MAIGAAWRGELPLRNVFWGHGVLVSTLVTAAYLWFAMRGPAGVAHLLAVVFVPYTAWILVSIWRCAGNVGKPQYGLMARALTAAWALNAALLVVFAELDLMQ